jgi:transposase-like protein
MTKTQLRAEPADWKALLADDADLMREIVRNAVQEILEVEMTEAVGAERGERSETRLGYRAGYYPRSLITRVGKLELRVPRDREGRFSTEFFERYSRSEKALVGALAEMYVQGVSTRKVKAITEELCGHSFFSLGHLPHQRRPRPEPGPVRRPAPGGALSLPDLRRAL